MTATAIHDTSSITVHEGMDRARAAAEERSEANTEPLAEGALS